MKLFAHIVFGFIGIGNTIGTLLLMQWLAWHGPEWIMMTMPKGELTLSITIFFTAVIWILGIGLLCVICDHCITDE